ncbi:hypothetical protein A6A40_17135 (plasmid) [Azospirillum humicireducens]|uniref:Uncharacterized protein n=1 Tax=Azospirillum humicireducens TaxID=1226968 RepID=A0A2R4VQQ5_9PROT|nr:hypothetical protein [Azospirillum humicireducens]AWB06778.1 hypothetical protein A6A40_17135 [Azospirillum humicireducens]
MKLSEELFKDTAQRHVTVASAALAAALVDVSRPFSAALIDVADVHLGWASSSLAIGRLYRRRY